MKAKDQLGDNAMKYGLLFVVAIAVFMFSPEVFAHHNPDHSGGPPTTAVKFFILKPSNSTVGTPVTVTIEARKSNNQVDTEYQSDVTLVTSGSATGGGLVDIVNGVGTRQINDSVAETVTLSLSDTEATGLDVDSTQQVTFSAAGGGGGGRAAALSRLIPVIPTTVTFSGIAFPGARVFIIDKDARVEQVVSQERVTADNGTFQVSFVGISEDQHSFGLTIKDKEGRPTQTKFFNLRPPANSITVKDVFVPPTVGFASGFVTRGRDAIITGYAVPDNNVIIEIDDTIKTEVKVKGDGSYRTAVNTGILEFGQHRVRVKQVDPGGRESDFSPTKALVISRLTLPKTDFSGDGQVDIKDWSIFLSLWSSKDEASRRSADLNEDGKIDISDFSIFIRTIKKR